MKTVNRRIPKFIDEKIQYFRECMIKKADVDTSQLNYPRTVALMWKMKEFLCFEEEEVDILADGRSISIRNLGHTNKPTKKKTDKLVIDFTMEPSLFRNKKGSNFDMLYLVSIMLFMAIVGVIIFQFWDGIYQDRLTPGSPFNNSFVGASVAKGVNNAVNTFDFVVPAVLILGTLGAAVLVYLNPIPAPFVIFGILFFPLLLYFAVFFGDMYITMITNSANFTELLPRFPLTDHIMRSMPLYVSVFYVLLGTVQYSRSRSSVAFQ